MLNLFSYMRKVCVYKKLKINSLLRLDQFICDYCLLFRMLRNLSRFSVLELSIAVFILDFN